MKFVSAPWPVEFRVGTLTSEIRLGTLASVENVVGILASVEIVVGSLASMVIVAGVLAALKLLSAPWGKLLFSPELDSM